MSAALQDLTPRLGAAEEAALREAQAMVARGTPVEAIEVLTRANRAAPSEALERELVRVRMAAFPAIRTEGPAAWPAPWADPFPDHPGIPDVALADLTTAVMAGAILHHGAVIVRGLIPEAKAAELRDGIDTAFAARDAHRAGNKIENRFYAPVEVGKFKDRRTWVEDGGGVWTADSPRMLFELTELWGAGRLTGMITEYFGERPALSVVKSTLRRVPVDAGTDWHQDGAFLGRGIRSVNIWVSLSHCGEDAAGLDIVGRRLPYIVQTGSHGSWFDWSVGPRLVETMQRAGVRVESPIFRPGDGILFDHYNLHRTGIRPHMTKERWAIESWFFAPSRYPMDSLPLVI